MAEYANKGLLPERSDCPSAVRVMRGSAKKVTRKHVLKSAANRAFCGVSAKMTAYHVRYLPIGQNLLMRLDDAEYIDL